MQIKKLEVFGFKSFADRTDFVFDRGVTCIVGPNGCGKSNVVDAVKWVFGEQSSRAMIPAFPQRLPAAHLRPEMRAIRSKSPWTSRQA